MRTRSHNQPSSRYRPNIIHRPQSVMGRDPFCLEYSLTRNPQRSKLSSNASILKNWGDKKRKNSVDVLLKKNEDWSFNSSFLPCLYLMLFPTVDATPRAKSFINLVRHNYVLFYKAFFFFPFKDLNKQNGDYSGRNDVFKSGLQDAIKSRETKAHIMFILI